MPKSGRDPYRARPCKYCKGRFVPVTKNKARADEQIFCCAAHRKEFWRSGSLPFEKLMIRFEKRCREIVREELAVFEKRLEFEDAAQAQAAIDRLEQSGHHLTAEYMRDFFRASQKKTSN